MFNSMIIDGDITELPNGINVIMHCCNTLNVMGSGVALALKDKWPEVYQADCDANAVGCNVLGAYSVANIGEDIGSDKSCELLIYNLYGQASVGGYRPLNYEALARSLEAAKIDLDHRDIEDPIIGIPYKMAADRAGGCWTVVGAMVNHYFLKDYPVVYVKHH